MSFSKRPDSDADLFPKPSEFRADDYAFLAAHPAPFRKFPEPFLCLIGMSGHYTLDEDTYPTFLHEDETEINLFAFIQVVDPTKVKVGERERAEGEARLLETTIGRVVPLLPVAPARAESELDASVDKLFDESGGADQGDSATGGGQETEADIVAGVRFVDAENVFVEKPKRPRKKRQVAADASGPSHPPKKLRSDHGTLGRAVSASKSPTFLKQLLASSILNVESGVEAVATLPFVTSSVSATPKHESGVPADSITGLNLRTVGASARFVISSDSSYHSSINFPGAEGDSIVRSAVVPPVMTEAVTTTHDVAGSSHPPVKEFFIGSREVDSESLYEIFVPRWNIPNDSLLDNLDASREFIDHVAPLVLFAQIRDMDYDELFTEFSVGTARQACLSVEVRMRTEYCLSERRRLESESEKQAGLLKSRDEVIENLKTQLLLKEAEEAEVAHLRTQVSAFEAAKQVAELQSLVSVKDRELKDVDATVTSLKSQNYRLADQVRALEISSSGLQEKVTVYENFMGQLESFQDDRMKVVNDKFDQLHTDFVEMTLHLEEKFYPHLLTTISCRRWLLTPGMELAVVKCLNSLEYLSMLGAAISKAIEKGIQDGLSAGITYGKEGRSLTDVAAYNPSAEADYVSALQTLQSVNFSLLAELKANKDVSVETLMDLLRLEEPLAEKLGLHQLQPTFDQLMVLMHHSPDQIVIGATALSLALDVSDIRVWKIRENIANQRSALRDVLVTLAEPFSSAALVGTEGTSSVVPAATPLVGFSGEIIWPLGQISLLVKIGDV
ncbi:hypothetical protein Tco_0496592 [Tanacetum coccineum]